MAIAYIQEFDADPGDRSTTGYDTVKRNMDLGDKAPDGLIVHTAGFDGNVFRIFDVWESEAHWTRFRDEQLMPAVEKMMAENPTGPPPARESTYELHDILPG
jgi:quinol monooxygenase YgiN